MDHKLEQYAYELLLRQHKQLNGNISLTPEVLTTAIFDIGLGTILVQRVQELTEMGFLMAMSEEPVASR